MRATSNLGRTKSEIHFGNASSTERIFEPDLNSILDSTKYLKESQTMTSKQEKLESSPLRDSQALGKDPINELVKAT
jgi:hypothetical protein